MSEKRLYISLGFDVTNFLGSLLDRGFGRRDSVVLIVPKNRNERNEEAIKRIDLLLSELNTRGYKIELEILELDEQSPLQSLITLISHIKEWEGEVYIDAVGGLRIFCVIMGIASVLVPKRNVYLSSTAESTGMRVDVPRISLTTFKSLTRAKMDVLLAIKKGKHTPEEIERFVEKDRSTISRHLLSLEESGLVRKIEDWPAHYEITDIGEIVIESLLSG